MTPEKLQTIIEAALMVAGHPLSLNAIQKLFAEDECPENSEIKSALDAIRERYQDSGISLHEVASGYRFQAKTELSPWLARLWEERPPRYSRAFMETLAIIAYKQPVTRAEIEQIRGVTVSSNIVRTLVEREWVRVVGQLEVPGKPTLYGTTKSFLDNFNLKSLKELPTLAEFKDMEVQDAELQVQLAIENSDLGPGDAENIPEERDAVVALEVEAETETETEDSADDVIAAFEADEVEIEQNASFEEDETELEEKLVASN
jgi:segregation and condensation protein B